MNIHFLKEWKDRFSKNFKSLFSVKRVNIPLIGKKKRLYHVHREFLKTIPSLFRRAICAYENSFVIFGSNGSGKTSLVKKCLENQQNLFPFETSYSFDQSLQCYIGSKCAVHEISWSLTEDVGIQTRKELIYLWERLYAKTCPVVVIAFDPIFWQGIDGDRCSHYAHQLFSKISLLASIVGQPLRIRIAVTHMDKMEGYSEIHHILTNHGIAMEISLANYHKHIWKESLDYYEKFLPLFLKNSSSDEYLRILNFFKIFPTFFSCLDQFVNGLMQKDGGKKVILIDSLVLTSSKKTDIPHSLFDCTDGMSPSMFIKKHKFKHKISCLSIIVLVSAYLCAIYCFEKGNLLQASQAMNSLEKHQSLSVLDEVISHLEPLTKRCIYDRRLAFLPSFFYSQSKKLAMQFIGYSRDYILFPKLKRVLMESGSEIKTIYLLGLIHSSCENRIGNLILENTVDWADTLSIPEPFVRYYVQLSENKGPFVLKDIQDIYSHSCLNDYKPWIDFFDAVGNVIDHPASLRSSLDEIKQRASFLLQALHVLKTCNLAPFVCKLLNDENAPGFRKFFSLQLEVIQFLKENGDLLEEFLEMVNQTSLNTASCREMNVSQFLTHLKEVFLSQSLNNKSYHFLFPDKSFVLDSSTWINLASSHKVSQLIKNYMENHSESGGSVFFKHVPSLFDISFSYLEEDFPLFKGGKTIQGWYTYPAYEKYVYSVANLLEKLNNSSLVDFEVKNQFNRFVAQEVESYAKQYRKSYQDILHFFEGKSSSLEDAKKVLVVMADPSSPFAHFLNSLKYHLKLPLHDSLILNPMHHLKDFHFLNTLIGEELDKPGGLIDYQRILTELLEDLHLEEEKGKEDLLLSHYLSPSARISLEILQEKESSYVCRVNHWMEKMSIPARYHHLFLNPVLRLHTNGLIELEKAIEACWNNDCYPIIQDLYSSFPFSTSSSSLVSVEKIEAVLHPREGAWRKIAGSMELVCEEKKGKWKPIYSSLPVHSQICAQLNTLSSLRDQFFDETGKKQPLFFRVKTVPFKESEEKGKATVLSYLVAGEEFLFNINQRPYWTTFSFVWWEPKTSQVGVELINPMDGKRIYRDIKTDHSLWSFFLLLLKARQNEERIWTWDVSEKFLKEKGTKCSFQFETDPWKIIGNYNIGGE